jgi:hypothetical protein
MKPAPTRLRAVCGWTAVLISSAFLGLWAFWGVLENFHEGWYSTSFAENLEVMVVQYFLPMSIFLAAALLAVRAPRIGAIVHAAFAAFALWFFGRGGAGALLIATPLVGLGVLYWVGRIGHRRLATWLLVGIPVLTSIGFGIAPAWRVFHRVDDGIKTARVIEGNGVALRWAPAGPGWPADGVAWDVARQRCDRLTADGASLAETPQHAWRLPTVDEVVRSLVRDGRQAGGRWNPQTATADYDRSPDKESPLWEPHSKIIYWWTGTEVDQARAYRVVYNGMVIPTAKKMGPGYYGYRCVAN